LAEHTDKETIGNVGSIRDAIGLKMYRAKIITDGTSEKPNHSILYFDTTDRCFHLGFRSHSLESLFKWLQEEAELKLIWYAFPEWGFRQLVVNIFGVVPFYAGDDESLLLPGTWPPDKKNAKMEETE